MNIAAQFITTAFFGGGETKKASTDLVCQIYMLTIAKGSTVKIIHKFQISDYQ